MNTATTSHTASRTEAVDEAERKPRKTGPDQAKGLVLGELKMKTIPCSCLAFLLGLLAAARP